MQGHINDQQRTYHNSLGWENRRYPHPYEYLLSSGRYWIEVSISCHLCQCENPLFPGPAMHSFKFFSRHSMASRKVTYE
jgi:hypothetical protein